MSNHQYATLSSPANIGSLTLKNRIVLAAMGSNFATADGHCSEQLIAYYETRARGGSGLLVLETSAVSWPKGAAMPNTVGFSSDAFIPGLTELTERVHRHGAKIAAQLNHSGKVAQEDTIAGRPLLVPSIPHKPSSDMMALLTRKELSNFIKAAGPDGKGPQYQEMDEGDIEWLIQQFTQAAVRAQKSNFDAVEIHAGHGYLISSFLSKATNKRSDEYGGSIENRARLLVEIIKSIHAAVGDDFPILVRMDAMEYRVDNGITPSDFIAAAKLAELAGADAIDVSAYGNTSKGIAFTEAPLVHQPGGFLDFAQQAKKSLNIPVIAVGRIEPDVAEKGLLAGHYDFVAMGRKLLADPELPNKLSAGNTEAIRPCIYCYICVSQIFINQPLCCAVNSSVGREHEEKLIPTQTQKKVVIVGGGPGGMEAARLLSSKGHEVVLLEKDAQLGGTARIAALAYEPNGRLIKFLSNSLNHSNIEVRLNTAASAELIRSEAPDHVIVATGAARRAPDIKGKHLNHVFDGEQMRGLLFGSDLTAIAKLPRHQRLMLSVGRHLKLLSNVDVMRFMSRLWMPIRKRVVIVGGGLVGLEMAEFLIERGRLVTVLEPSSTLAPELSIVRRSRVIHLLREHGAQLITNATVDEITEQQVAYQHKDAPQQTRADQVIIALGAEPELSVATTLKSTGLNVTAIGDCQNIGYIDGAILDARNACQTI